MTPKNLLKHLLTSCAVALALTSNIAAAAPQTIFRAKGGTIDVAHLSPSDSVGDQDPQDILDSSLWLAENAQIVFRNQTDHSGLPEDMILAGDQMALTFQFLTDQESRFQLRTRFGDEVRPVSCEFSAKTEFYNIFDCEAVKTFSFAEAVALKQHVDGLSIDIETTVSKLKGVAVEGFLDFRDVKVWPASANVVNDWPEITVLDKNGNGFVDTGDQIVAKIAHWIDHSNVPVGKTVYQLEMWTRFSYPDVFEIPLGSITVSCPEGILPETFECQGTLDITEEMSQRFTTEAAGELGVVQFNNDLLWYDGLDLVNTDGAPREMERNAFGSDAYWGYQPPRLETLEGPHLSSEYDGQNFFITIDGSFVNPTRSDLELTNENTQVLFIASREVNGITETKTFRVNDIAQSCDPFPAYDSMVHCVFRYKLANYDISWPNDPDNVPLTKFTAKMSFNGEVIYEGQIPTYWELDWDNL